MATPDDLRSRLRSLAPFEARLPLFDPDALPEEPLPVVIEWVEQAIDAGVVVPHAMTLATATEDGVPNARTLLLKDVDERGLWFASSNSGPKGLELEGNPRAALVLYWREQGRQVRVTGTVRVAERDIAERDFLARHPIARAGAIAGRQSSEMPDDVEQQIAAAQRLVSEQPDFVPEDWTAYYVEPETVEFWQATPDRDQLRVRYRRFGVGWRRDRLWP